MASKRDGKAQLSMKEEAKSHTTQVNTKTNFCFLSLLSPPSCSPSSRLQRENRGSLFLVSFSLCIILWRDAANFTEKRNAICQYSQDLAFMEKITSFKDKENSLTARWVRLSWTSGFLQSRSISSDWRTLWIFFYLYFFFCRRRKREDREGAASCFCHISCNSNDIHNINTWRWIKHKRRARSRGNVLGKLWKKILTPTDGTWDLKYDKCITKNVECRSHIKKYTKVDHTCGRKKSSKRDGKAQSRRQKVTRQKWIRNQIFVALAQLFTVSFQTSGAILAEQMERKLAERRKECRVWCSNTGPLGFWRGDPCVVLPGHAGIDIQSFFKKSCITRGVEHFIPQN